MATTLSLTPVNPSVEKGKTQKFTATVTGAPAGSTITYKWEVDGVTQASTVNTLDYVTTTVGKNVIKVTSTTKVESEPDDVKTATTEITVTKISQTTTAVASPTTQTINNNANYAATVTVTGAPAGSTITYLWTDGSTTASTTKKATSPGTIKLKCTVTVKATDYLDKIITTNEVTVIVEDNTPVIPENCPVIYVHGLPQRNSAFIWCGWWVMDEIEKITKAGGDWKNPPDTSKYKCHLATLAKMIFDYPDVDVQESRHGRIVHRSALESGIIY